MVKIKVGCYYKLKLNKDRKIAFAVMYGFDSGKNKDVYTLMMYSDKKIFEFPIKKKLFDKWVDEGRIKEINAEGTLTHIL